MDYFIAIIIVAISLYAKHARHIRTDFICLHLLWASCTCAALFLFGADYMALAYASLLIVMAGLYWTISELVRLCYLK